MRSMHFMNSLYRRPVLLRRNQVVAHMNTTDHQYAVLSFYFAANLGCQMFITRIDLARLQRATEGADQSTTGSGNHIIDGSCTRFAQRLGCDTVMFCDCAVNTKADWINFCRQVSQARRSDQAFDADICYINHFRHQHIPPAKYDAIIIRRCSL